MRQIQRLNFSAFGSDVSVEIVITKDNEAIPTSAPTQGGTPEPGTTPTPTPTPDPGSTPTPTPTPR